MNIAIVGVGGVGGFFGAMLARAGLDVTFVARGEQYRIIKECGLKVNSVDGNFVIAKVNVVDSIYSLNDPDLVLVCTKTYDRDEVAKQLSEVVKENTIIIPLQNGIDNDLIIREHCSVGKVYAGLVYLIASRDGFGKIVQSAGPRMIFFGERGKDPAPELIEVEKIMRSAGIKATASENIIKEIWLKFVWLTAFAGMTSICRSPIGPIIQDSGSRRLFLKCLDEGLAVAESQGISFTKEERDHLQKKTDEYLTVGPKSKSSMLVDIENRRKTEVDSLNGKIVEIAAKNIIPVPLNEMIYRAINLSTPKF